MVSEYTPNSMQIRNTLRQTFRERRRALSRSEQLLAGQKLLDQCTKQRLFINTENVALYLDNDGEVSTQYLIEYLWAQDTKVYLPVLHPFCDGYLLFIRYERDTPMRANGYGILEPMLDCSKVCPVTNLDYIFTPLVAFDESGNRLGMGGGFYDRTLMQVYQQKRTNPSVIGLAHDVQKTLSLPTEAWDIPLKQIMTPSTFYSFG